MVDQNTKVFVKQLLEILTGKNKYFWAADKQRWEPVLSYLEPVM